MFLKTIAFNFVPQSYRSAPCQKIGWLLFLFLTCCFAIPNHIPLALVRGRCAPGRGSAARGSATVPLGAAEMYARLLGWSVTQAPAQALLTRPSDIFLVVGGGPDHIQPVISA